MVLLTALFTCSCYWQAVPIESKLSKPIGNATTFAEAITDILVKNGLKNSEDDTLEEPLFSIQIPPMIQLVDRCWCSFSFSFPSPGPSSETRRSIFDPSDLSKWEMASIEHAANSLRFGGAGLERPGVDHESTIGGRAISDRTTHANQQSSRDHTDSSLNADSTDHTWKLPFPLSRIRNILRRQRTKSLAEHSHETIHEVDDDVHVSTSHDSDIYSQLPISHFYDLRPYGLDITIDFSWKS